MAQIHAFQCSICFSANTVRNFRTKTGTLSASTGSLSESVQPWQGGWGRRGGCAVRGLGSVIEVRTLRLLGKNPTGPAAAALWRSEVRERLFIRVFLDTFPFSGSLLTPSLYTNVPSLARMRAAPWGQKLSLQMSKEHGCPGSFPGYFPNMHFRKEN